MSPSIPNRLFSNEVSGLEVDHRHIDRTVEVRSRLPDTALRTHRGRRPLDAAHRPGQAQSPAAGSPVRAPSLGRLTPMPVAWRSVGLAADAPAGDLARDDPHIHIPRATRPGPDVGLLLQAAHVRLT